PARDLHFWRCLVWGGWDGRRSSSDEALQKSLLRRARAPGDVHVRRPVTHRVRGLSTPALVQRWVVDDGAADRGGVEVEELVRGRWRGWTRGRRCWGCGVFF